MAPTHTTSIPRLELCSTVLATQVVMMIHRELDIEINKEIYYSDSKVVLGYIQNESGRFYVYVANSVQLFCKTTAPSQWRWHAKMANTRLKSAAEKTFKYKCKWWKSSSSRLFQRITEGSRGHYQSFFSLLSLHNVAASYGLDGKHTLEISYWENFQYKCKWWKSSSSRLCQRITEGSRGHYFFLYFHRFDQ